VVNSHPLYQLSYRGLCGIIYLRPGAKVNPLFENFLKKIIENCDFQFTFV
jgi:hypothetical protein